METSKFDIADYLDSKEMIAKYLNTVIEEGNNSDIIHATNHVSKALKLL
jgi:DNA-binding phage protein